MKENKNLFILVVVFILIALVLVMGGEVYVFVGILLASVFAVIWLVVKGTAYGFQRTWDWSEEIQKRYAEDAPEEKKAETADNKVEIVADNNQILLDTPKISTVCSEEKESGNVGGRAAVEIAEDKVEITEEKLAEIVEEKLAERLAEKAVEKVEKKWPAFYSLLLLTFLFPIVGIGLSVYGFIDGRKGTNMIFGVTLISLGLYLRGWGL